MFSMCHVQNCMEIGQWIHNSKTNIKVQPMQNANFLEKSQPSESWIGATCTKIYTR